MGNFFRFVGLGAVLMLALFIAVIAGDDGPWYFAWLVGTVMIVLIAVAGALMLDAQSQAGGAGDEF